MGTDQQFCLRWNNFHTSITSAFESLRDDEDFVDITLACDGKQVKAHKMVLSACSPYFRNLLKGNPCQHPIVFLKDVTFANLASILDFMYHGEVNVSHNDLATFLKTAEALKVRGLAEDDKKKDAENYIESSSPGPPRDPPDPGSPKHDETSATDTHLSDSSPPPSKRHRRRSGASVQSAEDTSETVLSDLREASVKNEPQEFNDEDEMLGHSLDGTGDLKNDNVNSDVNDDRNFGHSESVSISRSQAAMQQLQESFGSFLPSMSQSSGFMPHGATDMARSSFPLEGVQGLPPGISTLPGPSMSQSNASQDGSQDVVDWRSPLSWRLEKHPLNQRYDSSCQFSSIIDVDEEVFSKGTNDYSSQRQAFEGGATQGSYLEIFKKQFDGEIFSGLTEKPKHQCPHCDKLLSTNHGLRRHIDDKHTVHFSTYLCHFCRKEYRTPNSLQNHMSVYHKRKPSFVL